MIAAYAVAILLTMISFLAIVFYIVVMNQL